MKTKFLASITAALILAALAGCGNVAQGLGSISVTIPSAYLASPAASGAKAVSAAAVVRIWLESQGGAIALGNSVDYYEATVTSSSRTVMIEGLPALSSCVLSLSVGDGAGAAYFPRVWASSDPFAVIAGVQTPVTLSASPTPFVRLAALDSASGVKALTVGGQTYLLAGDDVYSADGTHLATAPAAARGLSAGRALNPDGSFGAEVLWVDTADGVYPLAGSSFGPAVPGSSGAPIDSALALTLDFPDGSGGYAPRSVLIFIGEKDLGAADYVTEGAWSGNAAYVAAIPELSALKDLLAASSAPLVADIQAVAGSGGSVANLYAVLPAFSALALGSDFGEPFADPLNINMEAIRTKILDPGNFIGIPASGGAAPQIGSLWAAGGSVFAGSDQGLFSAPLGGDGRIAAGQSMAPIALGARDAIVKVRAVSAGGHLWAAALGYSGKVYIVRDGALSRTLGPAAGVPDFGAGAAATGDLSWDAQGLLVSGTNGAVRLPFGNL